MMLIRVLNVINRQDQFQLLLIPGIKLIILSALTNVFPNAEIEHSRSRGLLVTAALAYPSVVLAEDKIAANIKASNYNNFNLLIADPETALVLSWINQQLAINHLQPGLHELVNTPFSTRAVGNLDLPNQTWLAENEQRLTSHPQVCRHGDGYGTRCSHKILVGGGDKENHVWHLEGHPCQGKFVHVLGED